MVPFLVIAPPWLKSTFSPQVREGKISFPQNLKLIPKIKIKRHPMTIELKKVVHERLRRRGKLRRISQDELKEKCTPENGWIAVQGLVYDITPHIKQHPGWKCGCATSELMAILRCLGEGVDSAKNCFVLHN